MHPRFGNALWPIIRAINLGHPLKPGDPLDDRYDALAHEGKEGIFLESTNATPPFAPS
jgi:hypothetical protein